MAAPKHSRRSVPLPNPYDPNSPGYAERNATVAVEIEPKFVRVDIGQPAGVVRDILRKAPKK